MLLPYVLKKAVIEIVEMTIEITDPEIMKALEKDMEVLLDLTETTETKETGLKKDIIRIETMIEVFYI